MPATDNGTLYAVECGLFAAALVAATLYALVVLLRRTRPHLAIGVPMASALAIRILAVLVLPVTGAASSLRGGDETEFLERARLLNEGALTSDASIDALTSQLHTWIFALQLRALEFPEVALRIVHLGFAVVGLALMAAAVYELSGPRAATLAAWVLALEPASIFFSGLLHKESLLFLAGGLVAFGGAKLWARRDFVGLLPMVLGGAIGVATRPYAGWFLVAAGAAITLHATAARRGERQGMALAVATVVALLVALSVPTVLEESSDENLQTTLQRSQDANVRDDSALALERVDYSTRGSATVNLPIRIRDVLLRPYPWQLANTSQRLGLLGTVVSLALLALLTLAVMANPREVVGRAGPLVYPAFFLLVAYSLSAGNAGTSFRYRTHVVAFGVCIVIVLRERVAEIARARRAAEVALGSAPAGTPTRTPGAGRAGPVLPGAAGSATL